MTWGRRCSKGEGKLGISSSRGEALVAGTGSAARHYELAAVVHDWLETHLQPVSPWLVTVDAC